MQINGKQILDNSINGATKLTSAFLATLILAAGTNAFTADQSMGGFNLTNVADPVSPQDAATKNYVDSVVQGLEVKYACNVITVVDIGGTYSSVGGTGGTGAFTGASITTIDGVTITNNMRILVNGQTDPKQNGMYKVTNAGTGALERTADFDANVEIDPGSFTFIETGTVYASTGWVLQGAGPFTLNTSNLVFVQFSQTGTILAGSGLQKIGNTISVVAGYAISLSAPTSGGVNVNTVILAGASGSGLSASAGNPLQVVVGNGINIVSNALTVVAADASILVVSGGVKVQIANSSLKLVVGVGLEAATQTIDDKNLTPSATAPATNFQTSGLTISHTPANGSHIQVMVNGVMQNLALTSGARSTADCYFSVDGGTTARAIGAIVAGDTLYWNGAVAQWNLATTDRLDFCYDFAG